MGVDVDCHPLSISKSIFDLSLAKGFSGHTTETRNLADQKTITIR